MSLLKANAVQLGQSLTASQNFTWYQPSSPDGTVRLGNGNSGSVTDLVTLTSSGNLGIGTSSPGAKLHVQGQTAFIRSGASGSYAALSVGGTSSSLLLAYAGANNDIATGTLAGDVVVGANAVGSSLRFLSGNGTLNATLDSSGNLGLGVTPSAWYSAAKTFQIGYAGAIYANTGVAQTKYLNNAYYNVSGNPIYLNNGYAQDFSLNNSGQYTWSVAASGTAGNAISFTQAMTLDASGNLLVGTTSTTLTNGGAYIAPGSATLLDMGHASGSGSGNYYALFRYAGTLIGSITQNGTTGVLYNITSDQRLKTNVKPAESAIQSILDFPVDQFDWIADGTHQDFGAIAQKAHEVIPEMVSVPANEDEMWGIDWSKAVPRLIKTVQELTAELNLLKQKVNA